MQDQDQKSISNKWWFKLGRGVIVGAFRSLGFIWRGWGKLGKRGRIGVVAAILVLFVVAGIAGQRDASRAKSLGFASTAEMREAEKAGFHDKASWSKHLADVAAQAQAAEAAKAQEAKNRSAEEAALGSRGKTIGQWMDEVGSSNGKPANSSDAGSDSKEWRDDFGRTTKQACGMFIRFKSECISGENYSACMEMKYAGSMGSENRNAYMYDQQMCRDDGTSIINR